jgi:hypothetical protein
VEDNTQAPATDKTVKIIPNQGFEDYLPNMATFVTPEEADRLIKLNVAAKAPEL